MRIVRNAASVKVVFGIQISVVQDIEEFRPNWAEIRSPIWNFLLTLQVPLSRFGERNALRPTFPNGALADGI